MTSQICSRCSGTVVGRQKVVTINGKQLRKSLMGSSVCYNTFFVPHIKMDIIRKNGRRGCSKHCNCWSHNDQRRNSSSVPQSQ
jgi:hypothetical protein